MTAEAQLADGELVIAGPDAAEERRLRKLIEPRLPEVDLPELLIEVDGWTGFTDHLVPLSRQPPPVGRHAGPALRRDHRSGDEPRPLRNDARERVHLPAARMGVGAAAAGRTR